MPFDHPFIPQPTNGLVGRAEGLLNAGVNAMGEYGRYQTEQKQIKQKMLIDAQANGLIPDPNNPDKMVRSPQAQRALDEQDPTTDASRQKRVAGRAMLGNMNPELAASIEEPHMDQNGKMIGGMAGSQVDQILNQGLLMKQAMGVNSTNRLQMTQDNNIHQTTLKKIQQDPQVAARLNQYQNLSNALNNVANADKLTAPQIDELQQTIRSNMGIGKTSGVGEREHTYMNSLGLNQDRMMTFLTGNPVDIEKDNKIAAHFQNLAKLEQNNITGQMGNRINALAAGNGRMYLRRPDLKADLQDAIGAVQNQYSPQQGSPPNKFEQGYIKKHGESSGQETTPPAQSSPAAMSFEEFKARKKAGTL